MTILCNALQKLKTVDVGLAAGTRKFQGAWAHPANTHRTRNSIHF